MADHFRRLRASAITSSPGIASASPRRYCAYRRSASSSQSFSTSGSCPGSRSSMSTRTSAALSPAGRARMRFVRSSNWVLTCQLWAEYSMAANDRVERPTTMTVPRPDAAHDAPRSAPTNCLRRHCAHGGRSLRVGTLFAHAPVAGVVSQHSRSRNIVTDLPRNGPQESLEYS